ncbi:glycosyltransferase [Aliagarivorans taiwanensis]|uniref:glycosyltransferase n=1 Tax=Aliagarivorans taiwanensis TaxID=561966 RepID=UPI00146F9793|nr:glycosyltransferase [Aliagarivorans taiwanensis]
MISVYMPTCNRLGLLKRAVASVLSQTYTDFELIIVDENSTDGTKAYLSELCEQDARIKVLFNSKQLGACAARNRAIFEANGKYITGLDDDDEFAPSRLQQLLDAYNPNDAFVCQGFTWHYGSKARQVDTSPMCISLNDILSYNHATNQVLTETYKLREIGGFDPEFAACQDYDTWTRLILTFGNGKRLSGTSYIVHQGHEGPRVTSKPNKIKGYGQYFSKHQNLMTKSNVANQQFMQRVAAQNRYWIWELLYDLKFGYAKPKVRYFLAKLLPFVAEIRRKWLRSSNAN